MSGWLAGLALCPVLGQEIIEHPQDQTVCVGENAIFTTATVGDLTYWLINGTQYKDLPPEQADLISTSRITRISGDDIFGQALTVKYNEAFNGWSIQSAVLSVSESADLTMDESTIAYLFYETNQQSPATGLNHTITNTTAQVYWNELDSNFTTQYLFGVYDANNNLVANYTLNTTHANYDLPSRTDDSCQPLTVKVTADVCPDSDNGFVQTEATTFNLTIPCPTTATTEPETETEATRQPSGAQATLPSWLAVAAMVPLLRIARPAF